MKTRALSRSLHTLSRRALPTSLALAASLVSALAAAAENTGVPLAPSLDDRWHQAPVRDTAASKGDSAHAGASEGKYDGFSLNFTPVLVAPRDDERWGGGADPELKYTLDRGAVRLSAGFRVGAYYARNLFGVTAMPTLRLLVAIGPVEPYVSFGMGYGWLPKLEHSGIATMSRLGIVFRFSEKLALGIEGTIQRIERSSFEFPSFGSALAVNF